MKQFETDKEIVDYIKSGVAKINLISENRLFKEEQLQISDQVIKVRNATEWLIRINKVIKHIKYALSKSVEFAQLMESPIKETENSNMYSYYLEDAVYRDIVLWDIFRQLINEYYECGYTEIEQINIFKFLKTAGVKQKVGQDMVNKILLYLNSDEHLEVRNNLRNLFTHSVENTSSYIFHKKNSQGLIQPQMQYFLPKHPYENLVYVLDDINKILEFIQQVVSAIEKEIANSIMIVNASIVCGCGKVENLPDYNIAILREQAEKILCICKEPCEKAFEYQQNRCCKPVVLNYIRIHEKEEKYRGNIKLELSMDDLRDKYPEESEK